MIFFRLSENNNNNYFDKLCIDYDYTKISDIKINELYFTFISTHGLDEYVYVDGDYYSLFIAGDFIEHTSTIELDLKDKLSDSAEALTYLSLLDGQFSGFLISKYNGKVYPVSDKLGFGLLYYRTDGVIALSNLASSISVPNDILSLDFESVESFINDGYIKEDKTYYQYVKCCNADEQLIFNLDKTITKKVKYHDLSFDINKNERLDYVNNVLDESFEKIFSKYEPGNFICTLSGGQDSRLLLSHFTKKYKNITTLTFGHERCRDFKIVKKLRDLNGFEAITYDISNEPIIKSRTEYVLATDGMKDILHLHCNNHQFTNKVNLNGFLGDVVLGGTYIGNEINEIDKFNSRGRRFINLGRVAYSIKNKQFCPFVKSELVSMLYMDDNKFRMNNRFYKLLIEKFHGNYFNTVAIQRNNVIYNKEINPLLEVLRRKLRRAYEVFFGLSRGDNYTDYPLWLKNELNIDEYKQHISNINEPLKAYLSKDTLKNYRIITLSLLLSYVYE